jgi:hypothetical protein
LFSPCGSREDLPSFTDVIEVPIATGGGWVDPDENNE